MARSKCLDNIIKTPCLNVFGFTFSQVAFDLRQSWRDGQRGFVVLQKAAAAVMAFITDAAFFFLILILHKTVSFYEEDTA